jgi:hypothetical protein
MGKIEISDDLRSKLDKVLSYKSADIGDTAVGPAPSWKQSAPNPPQPPQPPPQPPQPPPQHQQPPQQPSQHQQPQQQMLPPQYYYVKPEKNKKKKDKIKYYKITKIVFLSSVVAGIGMTLGLKIANILFF